MRAATRHAEARGHYSLAETLGPLSDPGGARLSPRQGAELRRYRESCWQQLEARAGSLAERDPAVWYELLVSEAWRAGGGTGSLPPWALAFFYRVKPLLPRAAQLSLRRLLIKVKPKCPFPAWPFEPAGWQLLQIALADELLERGRGELRFPWFWPGEMRAAATLTHDVESEEGLARATVVAGWEEQRGLRSSFNIVGDWYPIDGPQLRLLARRGHEIGAHGIYHDRSLFSSRESFEAQLPRLRALAERLGAVGFRSPATHRVVEWLAELPFAYDCTMPHSDPYEPIPGGTATIWPFFHGDVVELPYTAPQDHTLFNLLGYRDGTLWCEQLERVVERNGLFQALTHPDPGYLGRGDVGCAYGELLDAIAGREDVWFALPREVASWWRRRRHGLTPRQSGRAVWTGVEIALAPAGRDGRAVEVREPGMVTASVPGTQATARLEAHV